MVCVAQSIRRPFRDPWRPLRPAEKPNGDMSEAFEARRTREFDEATKRITAFSPEAVEKIREEERTEDEARRQRLFGDGPVTMISATSDHLPPAMV